ncbi:hypothetical protein A2U01_0073831, partial [Trifolium medium]|nr:hypothetical protein [Trifolium medium]
MGEWLRSPTV